MGEAFVGGDEADAPAAGAGSQGLAERGIEAAEVRRVAEAGAVGRVDDDEVGRAFRPLKVADRGSGSRPGLGDRGEPEGDLSYAGVLPGFFDFRTPPVLDMAVICLISTAVLLPRQRRLGGSVRAGRAMARRPGGDAVDACRGRAGARGGGGGDRGNQNTRPKGNP